MSNESSNHGKTYYHRKAYLGDGVYVRIDEFGDLVLTTEDGIRATNTIVLEDAVVKAFSEYLLDLQNCPCAEVVPE